VTRACELAPGNPEYIYERGMVHWHMRQPDAAMADFDQALKLKPDDLPALMARAALLLQRGDADLAVADLDAADAIAPKEADERFQMAHAYERADRLATAIAQLTRWIDSHADDARLPEALNARCWCRALEGSDLALAVKDCNAALTRADKSIADYNASLKINAQNAWSLYGRGVDKLRQQKTSDAEVDIARATAVWPQVAEEFKRRGIVP